LPGNASVRCFQSTHLSGSTQLSFTCPHPSA
jgi:hypothetical protein